MKHNVDLTESRLFSREDAQTERLRTLIDKLTFPWNMQVIYSDSDMESPEKKLILEGTVNDRRKIREYIKLDSNIYCNRCGKYINLDLGILKLGFVKIVENSIRM